MDNKEIMENRERIKNAKWRQRFHIEPPDGWLNDPNGLSFYKGEYHVYFQYSPIAADGHTPRGWGHYHGADLMHMAYDKAVMMPDIPEDSHGVYSGSAIENDGVLHIFYTGNVKMEGDYDYVTAGRRERDTRHHRRRQRGQRKAGALAKQRLPRLLLLPCQRS
jgi:beta-fructofuranosidase